MIKYNMHITPDMFLHSIKEEDAYDNLFIAPIGKDQINEISDTIYIKDAFVPYHEHDHGMETFVIDKGTVEVTIRGKQCLAHEGDMIHIEPFVAHGFRFLEEGTIWRELFQEMNMYGAMMDKDALRKNSPEKLEDPEFMAKYREGRGTKRLGEPAITTVSKDQVPQIRPKGTGIQTFTYDGLICNMKVGRWETHGVKEIWEFIFENKVEICWDEPHPNWDLFIVREGSVEVEAAGEKFIAKPRDIINIPPYTPHKITTLESNTILHAYNCQSMHFRMQEDLKRVKTNQPEKLKDWEYIQEILRKHTCYITSYKNV